MAWVAVDKWDNEEYVFPDKPYKNEYNTWNCDGYIEDWRQIGGTTLCRDRK